MNIMWNILYNYNYNYIIRIYKYYMKYIIVLLYFTYYYCVFISQEYKEILPRVLTWRKRSVFLCESLKQPNYSAIVISLCFSAHRFFIKSILKIIF